MTAARAIGWELLRRNRWGFLGLGVYFAAAAAYKLWMLRAGHVFSMEQVEYFVFGAAIPLGTTITYLVVVFTYGLSGDFAARQSIFPARYFTLPVTTSALAGWPMWYGALAMTVVWAALRAVALWPEHEYIPVVWPAILGVAFLGWTQALAWLPYGLRGLRVVVLLVSLTVMELIVLLGLQFRVSEWLMIAMLAPLVPPAFLVARAAVGRARQGEVPDWSNVLWRGDTTTRPLAAFTSPSRAQAWFEWRRNGWSLPVLVGMLLPFELLLLWVAQDALSVVIVILLAVLLTPPFMASFTAATVRKASAEGSDSYSISPFIAARPLSSASLIAAKLRMTMWSTLLTWALVLVAIPIALVWSPTWPMVAERSRYFASYWGAGRAIALLVLVILICMLSTWRQMVQSLYIGLSGREWLVRGSVGIAFTLLSLAAPLVIWIIETPAAIRFLIENFTLILAVLAVAKMAVGGWVAVRLWQRRVLSDRTLLAGTATWLAAVLALYGVFAWMFAGPQFTSHLFALAAILIVPLARLSAAPLALDRHRHR